MWGSVSFGILTFQQVDRAPAFLHPAKTNNGGLTVLELVVHGQFFALLDASKGVEVDSVPANLRVKVWVAGVVDPLGSTAPYRPVQRPVVVQTVSENVPALTRHRFMVVSAEQLPRVFDDILPLGDVLFGNNTPAVNGRLDDL